MSEETTKRIRKPDSWIVLRQHLATVDKAALLTLLKDLYDVSASNRDFIQARCQSGDSSHEILEKYRAKVVEQFYPARGKAKLKLREASKAISDYRKATGNLNGTAELLMTYVENGAEFTHEYGDIDQRFYSSIESVLDELASLLLKEVPQMYPQLKERLERVEGMAGDIGWGFQDYVSDAVWQLEAELGDE